MAEFDGILQATRDHLPFQSSELALIEAHLFYENSQSEQGRNISSLIEKAMGNLRGCRQEFLKQLANNLRQAAINYATGMYKFICGRLDVIDQDESSLFMQVIGHLGVGN